MLPADARLPPSARQVIREEEASFSRTLVKGIERFKKAAAATTAAGGNTIDGAEAFVLWDTYGFPVDLTQVRLLTCNMQFCSRREFWRAVPPVCLVLHCNIHSAAGNSCFDPALPPYVVAPSSPAALPYRNHVLLL